MCDPRMYVIVREDLAYKYIQGAHALSQFGIDHRSEFEEWNNRHLIYLSVFNGISLEGLLADLITDPIIKEEEIKISTFYEPDLKSQLPTAICMFEDGTGYVSRALKGLQLATR